MIKLTIFTPTYNRKHLLTNLYESLNRQTCKNFEWLIVDDGSVDGTDSLVDSWKNLNLDYKINYVKKENGGKHTAIDKANEVCKTDYIICVDSDDYLTDNAVKLMYEEIEKIDKLKDVCGVVTRRVKPNGEPFSNNWVPKDTVLYFNELASKYGFHEDTGLLFKTAIVNKYKFPKFNEERFVTETVYYNQFLYDYKMLASSNLYYVSEYMPDGYTAQGMGLFFKNPNGFLYALKQNAYYGIVKKATLKHRIGLAATFYAWKRVMQLKEKYPNDYKLPLMYRVTGRLLSFKMVRVYNKGKELFYRKNK